MNPSLTARFSFGKIVVDPKSSAIYFDGVEKRLETKLIALLCLLAAQGRSVISRQDINQAIWSDVVVTEESITRAIFLLRNILGDDAKQPKYIETIPKKGYRFLAEVELIDDSPSVIDPVEIKKAGFNWRLQLTYLCGLAFVGALLVFLLHEKTPAMEIESIVPMNKMEGAEVGLNLSANGEKLLFVHANGNGNDIYSRDVKSGKDVAWGRDEFLKRGPIWIDENSIAYVRWSDKQYQIVRQNKDQAPRILYPSIKHLDPPCMLKKNSKDLFFLERGGDLVELKSLNLSDGKQQNWRDSIPGLPRTLSQLQPSTQPDTLLMVKDEDEQPVIISLDLSTKKIMVLSSRFTEITKVTAINSHAFLVVGAINKTQGIWLVDKKKQPQIVLRSSGSEQIVDVQIDVKNNTIFYANSQMNVDVKQISMHDQSILELPELNFSGMDIQGRYGSANKEIYFLSNRTGNYEIWRYEIDSKTVKQITSLNAPYIFSFLLSHDGKSLAVSYKADDLYLGIVDVETGYLQRNVKTPRQRLLLEWSFDNQHLYVSEYEPDINTYSYDVATLKPSLFLPNAGLYVKSLDDKTLIYVDYERHALITKNLITQQEKILHDKIANLRKLLVGQIKFNKKKNEFYTICEVDEHSGICSYSLSLSNSPEVVIKDIPARFLPSDIDEDGESILVAKYMQSSGDIMKMQLRH